MNCEEILNNKFFGIHSTNIFYSIFETEKIYFWEKIKIILC